VSNKLTANPQPSHNALLALANPTQDQLDRLRDHLALHPGLAKSVADMGALIIHRIVNQLAGQPALQIALHQQIADLMAELGYDHAPALERMLIENVVVHWLRWQQIQAAYHKQKERGAPPTSWERRLSAANARYLRAIESLARIRRLLARAPVQVNIAQQQIVNNS
jgi:hypothetical protein